MRNVFTIFVVLVCLGAVSVTAQMPGQGYWDYMTQWSDAYEQEMRLRAVGDQSRNGWHRRSDGLMGRRCPVCGCDNAMKGSDGTTSIVCCCNMKIGPGSPLEWALIRIGMRV